MTAHTNTLVRYWRLDPRCKRLLWEATAALGLASFAVAALPFRRAIALGAVPLSQTRNPDSMNELRWAVEAAASRLPWRTMCIEQGIALQRLLRRRCIDARLHYGARLVHADAGLKAHVWLTVGEDIILGAEAAHDFAELAVVPGP